MATAYTEAQEEYWQLCERRGVALAALTAADAAYQAFATEHAGETFMVFRPEDIERAISPDIEPLFLGEVLDTLTGGVKVWRERGD